MSLVVESEPSWGGLVQPHLRRLAPYVPGQQPQEGGWIKLNTNESPYAPSPAVAAAVAAAAGESLRLYPEPASLPLRQALAEHHGLSPSQVFVGNGSDEVLALLIRAFAGSGAPVGCLDPSYSLYPVLAAAVGAEVARVPVGADFTFDPDAVRACPAPLFLLTTPHAPSGRGFDLAALARAADRAGLLVCDEAYAAFAEADATPLLARGNVAVVRTFSKSHGLAGLRVGYLLGPSALVDLLDRLRDSYNVDRLAQAGARAALGDTAYLEATVGRIRATREAAAAEWAGWGWRVVPSQTNFLFVEPQADGGQPGPSAAADCDAWLRRHRVLVRRFPSHPLTAAGLRITVGTEEQMRAVSACLFAWKTRRDG